MFTSWTNNCTTPSLMVLTDDDDDDHDGGESVSSSSSSHDGVSADFDTVHVMRQQEASMYEKKNPLHHQGYGVTIDIDEICRNKMCEWSYQIVDFCKFRRESVDVAMNYLDRFLLTASGTGALQDRNEYQLLAMTCLYSAIKIHERQALSPTVVSQLSRGIYTAEQITETEVILLHALQWQLHPPTAFSFVRELITAVLHDNISDSMKAMILDIAQKQTELAVSDYRFIETPMSTIAYCAIMNSLECCDITSDIISHVSTMISSAIGLKNPESILVIETQMILWTVCPLSSTQNHNGPLDYSASTLGVEEMKGCVQVHSQHPKEHNHEDRHDQSSKKQQERRMSLDESPRSSVATHVSQ